MLLFKQLLFGGNMNKQILLIDKQGQRQPVEVSKYIFKYDNGTNFSLEFGNAWNHEELLLRSAANDGANSELSVGLSVRPFSADTVYVKPLGLLQDPALLVRESDKPNILPQVLACTFDGQQLAVEIAQIVCIYENGLAITIHIPISDFPRLAMEEIGIEAKILGSGIANAERVARLSFEINAANLLTIKPLIWEPKFACHTGKCNYD